MRVLGEALVKWFFTGIAIAVILFVIVSVVNLGLEALRMPHILAPVVSVLGSTGAYLEVLGARKNLSNLRYAGRLLIVMGVIALALLIAKLLEVL